MNDIKFIRDDVQEKKMKELQEIINVLSAEKKSSNSAIGKRFFYSMLKASVEIKKKRLADMEKEKKIHEIETKKPPMPKTVTGLPSGELSRLLGEVAQSKTVSEISKFNNIPKMPLPQLASIKTPSKEEETLEIIKDIAEDYPFAVFRDSKKEVIANINLSKQGGKYIYELQEPEIDMRLVDEAKKLVNSKVAKDRKLLKDRDFLHKNIKKAFKKAKIDYTEKYRDEVLYFLLNDLAGLGRIDPVLHDPDIRSISCDGLNKPVKISLGPGVEIKTNIVFTNQEDLDNQVKHLGMRIGQDISENNPAIEGTYYHFRINATLGIGDVSSKFMIIRMP